MVETDVENSTQLWEWDPQVMSVSLLQHDEVLRHELQNYDGIELLTEGDSFVVCFTEVFVCFLRAHTDRVASQCFKCASLPFEASLCCRQLFFPLGAVSKAV